MDFEYAPHLATTRKDTPAETYCSCSALLLIIICNRQNRYSEYEAVQVATCMRNP